MLTASSGPPVLIRSSPPRWWAPSSERSLMAIGCAPTFEEIALTDALTAWRAAMEGACAWWAGAVRRRAMPADLMLDYAIWWGEMAGRRPPSWSSEHRIVFEAPEARLRDFSTTTPGSEVVPTLVLPPQAGHDSCIVDFSPEQSQMRTILET